MIDLKRSNDAIHENIKFQLVLLDQQELLKN